VSFTDLFVSFWWLIFPIFGMFIAIWGMIANERRARAQRRSLPVEKDW